jgi:hypothetical protein
MKDAIFHNFIWHSWHSFNNKTFLRLCSAIRSHWMPSAGLIILIVFISVGPLEHYDLGGEFPIATANLSNVDLAHVSDLLAENSVASAIPFYELNQPPKSSVLESKRESRD